MNYILEANLGFLFFYGIYFLSLEKETDFKKQRIFLLAGLVGSLIFPLIHLEGEVQQAITTLVVLPEFVVNGNDFIQQEFAITNLLLCTYLGVIFLIAAPLLFRIIKLYRISRTGRYKDNYYIVESNSNNPSWSFFHLIFIGQSDQLSSEEKDLILKHEMLHGRLFHSADIILLTILCLVCWFNPVVWIYRRTLARIHEFEVDSIVAGESSPTDYGILLAKTVLSGNGFLVPHHFNQSFILKRINMLNVIKSRLSNRKLAALAATVVLYFVAVSCTEQVTDKAKIDAAPKDLVAAPDEVFTIVDEMAMPVGGIDKFYESLAGQLYYPEQARKMGVEGKVFVEFVIQRDGKLTDFKVLKGIGAGCDAEAMRVLSTMEPWTPGKMRGNAVMQKLVLPITFKLN